MVALFKVVLEEFKTHIVKMAQNFALNEFVVVNYELLCDVESIMGLIYVIPMVESVQILSKYVQNWNMLIYNFVSSVKLCQVDLHKKYCDEEKKYSCTDFF